MDQLNVLVTGGARGIGAGIVEQLSPSLENPAAQVVFCTASRDTRYEGYGILRPLIESDLES